MKRFLRRGALSAVVALAVLPAAANAAFAPTVSVSTLTAGCGPRGLNALPSSGGALAAGTYKYKVEATVGGTDTTPCQEITTGSATANAAFLVQWETTPGATQYKVFRNDALVKTVAAPTAPTTLGGCPASTVTPTTDPVARCFIVDNAGNSAGSEAPRALPTSSTAAGSSPDLNIAQGYDYGGASATDSTDDPQPDGTSTSASLRTSFLHFPTGLVANPTATGTAVCSLSQLIGDPVIHGTADPAEDKCPRASQVGTVLASIKTPGSAPATPTVGDVYIGAKLSASDPVLARLYVVLRPACSPGSFVAAGSATCTANGVPAGAEVEKSFLSAKATIRNDGTYGIDNEVTDISTGSDQQLSNSTHVDVVGTGTEGAAVPIQVQKITQYLFGRADQGTASTADDAPFVLMPTSCAAKTFGVTASSYLDPAAVNGSAALQATNCEAVPFSPTLTAEVDATGQSAQGGHPAITTAISQAVGEASQQKAVVTLPQGLGTNLAVVGNACTQAQLSSNSCPAASKIGDATAVSPLVGPLSGPVYLTQSATAGALPELDILLSGAISAHLVGQITLDTAHDRLVNTFDNLPETPLTAFSLSIAGGSNGLLTNSRDLCSGLGTTDATFTGYNGKSVTVSPGTSVKGAPACAPGTYYYVQKAARPKISVKLRGVKKGKPRVSISIKRGSAIKRSNPRKTEVTLPKGFKFHAGRKAKKRITIKVNGKRLGRSSFHRRGRVLTIRSKSTTHTITVSTKSRCIKETRSIRKHHKKKRTFKFSVKVDGGKTFHVTKRVKPRS
jgi:hypothetical protein